MESLVKERQKRAQKVIDDYRTPRVGLVLDIISIAVVVLFLYIREPEGCKSNQVIVQAGVLAIIFLLFDLFNSLVKISEGGSRYDYIEAKIRLDHLNKIIKEENQKPPQ